MAGVHLTWETKASLKLRRLYRLLNCGALAFEESFSYHPHITLAQDLTREQAEARAEVARERWAAYDGPREFQVEELSFVRSNKPGVWQDLAYVDLAQPVSSAR